MQIKLPTYDMILSWCLQVVIGNGVLEITISNPDGIVTKIKFNGIENLLEETNEEDNRGYIIYNYTLPSFLFVYLRI